MQRVYKRKETEEVLSLFPLTNTNFTKSSAANPNLGWIKNQFFQETKSPQKYPLSFCPLYSNYFMPFKDNLGFICVPHNDKES